MRVGITGSTGFIGSALTSALRARGDDVVRFVRPDSRYSDDEIIRWNPLKLSVDEGDLGRIGGFDAVVHLAGAGIADRRWSPQRKQEIVTSRTNSTALLVEALRATANGTPLLASGSAIGYYGSRGDEILDETSSCGGDFLAVLCAQWESAANVARQLGASVANLRTGIVMSTHGGALKKQLPLFRWGAGGQLSTGRQWLSPISLADEVRAILWVLDHRLEGPVNLVAPIPLTNHDFTKSLGTLLGRPTFARVPAFALKVALGGELATDVVLASQRVLPNYLINEGFTFTNDNVASILRAAIAPSEV